MKKNKAMHVPHISELLEGLPSNWGKWGPEDEVGSLNYLGPSELMRGVAAIRKGKIFTLQTPMGSPDGDPIWPGRVSAQRYNHADRGHFEHGKIAPTPGGHEFAHDTLTTHLHGTTHTDALGHVWYGDQIYNGFDAATTVGSLSKASVLPIAERAVVGHAVLIDIARHRGKSVLDPGESFDHNDICAAAAHQGITIEKRDILLVRTGWIGSFFQKGAAAFYQDFEEPGLRFSRSLVSWFADMEIPNLVTDTIANELLSDSETGVQIPLHCALLRNLGVLFTEIAALDSLAEDCANDGQWNFLYAAAPLKVVGGTAAPVNPVAIK